MAVARRKFLGVLAASTAALWLPAEAAVRRALRAASARGYPGNVAPLDEERVKRPGKWAG